MKQIQILGVSGSTLITSGGVKKAGGNRLFQPGDYAWAHGDMVFGHERYNGTPPVEVGAIPILLGGPQAWPRRFEYGFLDNALKYTKLAQYPYTMTLTVHGCEPVLVNNGSSAYLLTSKYMSIPLKSAQINLLKPEEEWLVGSVPVFLYLDACIGEDGSVVYAASLTAKSYSKMTPAGLMFYWAQNEEGYFDLTSPTEQWTLTETVPDMGIYRNGEKIADVGAAMKGIADFIEDDAKASTPGHWAMHHVNVEEMKTVVNPDGSYQMFGLGSVGIYYHDKRSEFNTQEGSRIYSYAWEIRNGNYSCKKTRLLQGSLRDDVWTEIEEFTEILTEDYDLPINDGHYAGNYPEMTLAPTLDFYNVNSELLGHLELTNSAYDMRVACWKQVGGAALFNLYFANHAVMSFTKQEDGSIVPAVVISEDDGPCLNARFEKTGKVKQIKAALDKILGG